MPNCEDLVTIDAFVSSNLFRVFESQRQPMKMLEISDFSSFLSRIHSEPALKRTLEGFSKVYREADSSGYKIEPERCGGFGLYNRTGKILKPKLEPLGDVVGILEDTPPELQLRLKPLSIMKSSSSDRDVVLLGVVRFVNHSCLANTQFFQGYSCQYLKNRTLRLQVTRTIYPDEEITADYGDSFFNSVGECKCDVCSMESELPMYPEQIENTAERSVECFLDIDNLDQESEQIVGSDIKIVLVSTEEKLLPALTTADETTSQASELNEGFDEKFSDAHLFGTFGNERKGCKRKKFPKHRTPSKVKKGAHLDVTSLTASFLTHTAVSRRMICIGVLHLAVKAKLQVWFLMTTSISFLMLKILAMSAMIAKKVETAQTASCLLRRQKRQ